MICNCVKKNETENLRYCQVQRSESAQGCQRYHSVRETWGQGQRGCVSALKSSGQKHSKSSWLWQEKPRVGEGLREGRGCIFSMCLYFLWMFEVWQWVSMTQAINRYSKFKLEKIKKEERGDFPSDLMVMNLPCSGRNTSSILVGEPRYACEQVSPCAGVILMLGRGGGAYGFLIDFRLTPFKV